jgi:hypothetical protein
LKLIAAVPRFARATYIRPQIVRENEKSIV